MKQADVVIIGGGLAGLVLAHRLSDTCAVLLIEKNSYPFHRVCGEYISNEVKPFLVSRGLFPQELAPASINRLKVSSPSGKRVVQAGLPMGGFGISRYELDFFLYKKAKQKQITILENTQVQDVRCEQDQYTTLLLNGEEVQSKLVIGAYGKRSNLDRSLHREFFYKRSPYIGVKYHIRHAHPANEIALHNFRDGYCGMSAIEDGKSCLCYLTTREQLKAHGDVPSMEKAVLFENPLLKDVFQNADFLWEKPLVINEITFDTKSTVDHGLIYCGDAAGMIAPLCGNGMSMAIHSAKLLSEAIQQYSGDLSLNKEKIMAAYSNTWTSCFSKRLWIGRTIQGMFGRPFMTELVVQTLGIFPALNKTIIRATHGDYI